MRYLLFALLIMVISGCGAEPQKSDTTDHYDTHPEVCELRSYLEHFTDQNRSNLSNIIATTEAASELANGFMSKFLGDSIRCISHLPLILESITPYKGNNKYAVLLILDNKAATSFSSKFVLSFQILSIMEPDQIVGLNVGSTYSFNGSCYDYANCNSTLRLPNGKCFEDYPSINIDDNIMFVNLGTLVMENLTLAQLKYAPH